MNFWLVLLIAVVSVNLFHYIAHVTSYYTLPIMAKIWFKYILRRKDYKYIVEDSEYKSSKEQDLAAIRLVFSIAFWNILTIMGVIAYPLSLIRYIFLAVFTLLFHVIGLIKMFEAESVEKHYQENNANIIHKDYEKRNIALANAIVLLEKENVRLKRIAGEPLTNKKKYIRASQIRTY